MQPAAAVQMDKIASQPSADWFDDPPDLVRAAVAKRVVTIANAGALTGPRHLLHSETRLLYAWCSNCRGVSNLDSRVLQTASAIGRQS